MNNRGLSYIYNASPVLLPWMAKKLDIYGGGFGDNAKAIGVLNKDKEIIAGCAYHNYIEVKYGNIIELSIYSTTPFFATNQTIAVFLSYPLSLPNIKRIWAQTSVENITAQKFLSKVGFYNEGVHKNAFDGLNDALSYNIEIEKAKKWLMYLPDTDIINK